MKTDIFLLKISKSCLSDAKTKYLIEEWYSENYGIDPDVIGHATMWQVVWENCQEFIGRFWSVKQVLELIQRDSFHQPSGDYNRDFVFKFFGKVATDKDIYDKVGDFYEGNSNVSNPNGGDFNADNFRDSKFEIELDQQDKWVELNLRQRHIVCDGLNSKFNFGPYYFYTAKNIAEICPEYILRWTELYIYLSDDAVIDGGKMRIVDGDNPIKYEVFSKPDGFIYVRFNFPNISKYESHIRYQRIYLGWILESK